MEGKKRGNGKILPGTLLAVAFVLETCFKFTNAVEATISPDQVILWGSTVTISCTLDVNDVAVPSDILWYKDTPDEALPTELSQVVGNNTSRLTLSVVTNEDSGVYYCALPSDGKNIFSYQSSRLTVGKLPSPPVSVLCHSRDMVAFWCTWQSAGETHLPTQYTFQYRGRFYTETSWRDCPDYLSRGEKSCYIPPNSNTGQEQLIRITETNALGSATRNHNYNPDKSTIPNPPTNVRAEIVSPREVQVRWDIPEEWLNYMSNLLSYRLRIWESGNHVSKNDQPWREIPSKNLIRRGRFIQTSFHTIHNLQPGTQYNIQAASKYRFSRPRGGCWSDWSLPVEVELPAITPSGTVNDLEVIEYHQRHDGHNLKRDVILTWEPVPSFLQNGEILNYTICVLSEDSETANGTVEMFSLPADTTTYELEGLNLHKEYGIGISACNSAGCGPNATIRLETQELVPQQPIHLRVLDLANQSLLVTWSIPEFDGRVDHFVLQWTQDLQSDYWEELHISGNEYQYLIDSPHNPATYSFRVQAVNYLNQPGPWSRTLTVHLDGIQLNLVL
ncbi:Interleukin-12 receptor subunit beta-2 [Holothuria leucospilota]|uniref:Interleukin-12 receptor subunit beta-2 n=1 Tax=Holothuria leucospilota TaxID=206669 RepID=A0A9Q1C8Z4_HOLLE|nr:Interleukin-12 receptor subunit beta-2 [Holothuria leucospilota]